MMNEQLDKIYSELSQYNYVDYLKALQIIKKDPQYSSYPVKTVYCLRSYTAEFIGVILEVLLGLQGFRSVIQFGDYNQFSQEILDPASRLYQSSPDIVLLLTRLEDVLPDFFGSYSKQSWTEWKDILEKEKDHFMQLVHTLNANLNAIVLVQNFAIRHLFWGILDSQRNNSQQDLLQSFNHVLKETCEQMNSVLIWDYERFVQKVGFQQIENPKLWYTSKCPFDQAAFIPIGQDIAKYLLSVIMPLKKCIVLDLDNTLWGGVVGEDGLDNIQLGHDYPGNCYLDFQKKLLQLHERGILLCINSKNNEADAMAVFERHPEMILKKEYFSAFEINWNDKASNVRSIAETLNIGIDSMIFIDDNPVECGIVAQQCPDCTVVQLPKEPYLIPAVVDELPLTHAVSVTKEDVNRTQIYHQQAKRTQLKSQAKNLDDFLKSLNMEISIEPISSYTLPRVSQLTQKTNQFNLTTRRYTEADIREMLASGLVSVFTVSCVDRFGDNGIIGTMILKKDGKTCGIDTFLLSCRVISRTVEQSMMAYIVEYAKKNRFEMVRGEYLPTSKNKPCESLFSSMRFLKDNEGYFIFDLKEKALDYSPFIALKST
jgi:FkbH-like protein